MAEEIKKECACSCGGKMVMTLVKVIIGLGLLVLGILAVIRWRYPLLMIMKGFIGLFLILVGIITLAIAKE